MISAKTKNGMLVLVSCLFMAAGIEARQVWVYGKVLEDSSSSDCSSCGSDAPPGPAIAGVSVIVNFLASNDGPFSSYLTYPVMEQADTVLTNAAGEFGKLVTVPEACANYELLMASVRFEKEGFKSRQAPRYTTTDTLHAVSAGKTEQTLTRFTWNEYNYIFEIWAHDGNLEKLTDFTAEVKLKKDGAAIADSLVYLSDTRSSALTQVFKTKSISVSPGEYFELTVDITKDGRQPFQKNVKIPIESAQSRLWFELTPDGQSSIISARPPVPDFSSARMSIVPCIGHNSARNSAISIDMQGRALPMARKAQGMHILKSK